MCSVCKSKKNLRNFYEASNPVTSSDGKTVNVCKNCIKKKSLNADGSLNLENFKESLMLMDKPFAKIALDAAMKETKIAIENNKGRKDLIGNYMKNIASLPQYAKLSFLQSMQVAEGGILSTSETYKNTQELQQTQELVYSKKWKGNYTESDIEYLDDYYEGLDHDYKVVTENHKDYARKIAKASLQMDKCFEDMMSDVTGADTRYKNARETFDALCKSAKFSESTRSINDVGISSFSKIAEMVENHNWIPVHMPKEKDVIDELLESLSTITKSV